MPRKRLSEFRTKSIIYGSLGLPYEGWSIDLTGDVRSQLSEIPAHGKFVVKVDQAVKGRFKKGLVFLDQTKTQLRSALTTLASKGYQYALVEPYRAHTDSSEHYLAMERTRAGNMVMSSAAGGIDIEAAAKSVTKEPLKPSSERSIEQSLELPVKSLAKLGKAFDDNFFSFLEINPLIIEDGQPVFLDAAAEVDDEATPFVQGRWTQKDFREHEAKSPYEEAVEELASKSQASFRLKVLNPNGSVFLLLSGGGASIVVADEVHNQGFGKQLANYGEYSGNPSEEETYLYTKQVVDLLLKSTAPAKVLVISGGVANFTDIRVTFRGVIHALDEVKQQLVDQKVKVYVRRGGPHEDDGLAMMEAFLVREGLHGLVAGPELPLSSVVPAALKSLTKKAGSK